MSSVYMEDLEDELGILGEEELDPEYSFEVDGEGDHESDPEADQFFGTIAKMARAAYKSPALRGLARKAALGAARAGLKGLGGAGASLGQALGGSAGGKLGRDLGGALGKYGLSALPQRESEMWNEYSFEDLETDGEIDHEVAALMEHLASSAAEADNEEERFAFLAPLAPLALKALASKGLPLAAKLLPRLGRAVAPHLTRGIQGIARSLAQNPQSKNLIRTLPAIARNTTTQLVKQAAAGRPVTPQTAVQTLARQANSTISNPARLVNAYKQSRTLDRRYHATHPRMRAAAAGM